MSDINVNAHRINEISQALEQVHRGINNVYADARKINLSGIIEIQARQKVERSLIHIKEDILNEAVKMGSLSDALRVIADTYQKTESAICTQRFDIGEGVSDTSTQEGTDKRSGWSKFWDWVFNKTPDKYDTTTDKQEKAADRDMRKRLWTVLQDEKYSEEHWDNATIDERKQILQDYMNEVILIYGLKDVKPTIVWDKKATYTKNSITWGYYTHSTHKVTLNESALSDSIGSWDSYLLLETVGHELRHAYQHEAINHPTDFMVSKETISTWKDNFKHYIKSDVDYEGYRKQAVEVDARSFQVSRNGKY